LGGEDFWKQAEDVLRSTTTKCLFVLSRVSNSKEGPLQELHVAKAIARSKSLNDFVSPLRVDNLPHASFNVELGRLNAVDFELGWSHGLSRLLEKLQRDSGSEEREAPLPLMCRNVEAAHRLGAFCRAGGRGTHFEHTSDQKCAAYDL